MIFEKSIYAVLELHFFKSINLRSSKYWLLGLYSFIVILHLWENITLFFFFYTFKHHTSPFWDLGSVPKSRNNSYTLLCVKVKQHKPWPLMLKKNNLARSVQCICLSLATKLVHSYEVVNSFWKQWMFYLLSN